MSCGNSIEQLAFTVPYLGLSDTTDTTYAGKAGWNVSVNPASTGTILTPPVAAPNLSTYLTTALAATTYATQSSFSTLSTTVTSLSTSVSSNTANIATNTANIATNTAAITALQARPQFFRNGTATPPTTGTFYPGDIFLANQT